MFEPRCPQCGRKCTPTGYSAFFPQWRCKHCMRENAEKKENENRIKALEKRIEELEKHD